MLLPDPHLLQVREWHVGVWVAEPQSRGALRAQCVLRNREEVRKEWGVGQAEMGGFCSVCRCSDNTRDPPPSPLIGHTCPAC